MAYIYTGRVVAVLPKQTGVSRRGDTWAAQDFVIEIKDSYQRQICFQLWGEEKISTYLPTVGDIVDVFFEIESREFKGRYYSTIKAWKVGLNNGAAPKQPTAPQSPTKEAIKVPNNTPSAPQTDSSPSNYNAYDDDMPF